MSDRRIRITYGVVTPESAKIGDFADSGWENEEGVCIDPDDCDIEEAGDEFTAVVDLAVKAIRDACGGVEASDYPTCCPGYTWYTSADGSTDYRTGAETRYSAHLDGFSGFEELAIYAELVGR